jgi:hypothetical protein
LGEEDKQGGNGCEIYLIGSDRDRDLLFLALVVEIEGDGGQELQTDFRSGELGKGKGGDVRYADWRSDELGGLRGTDGKTGDRMWVWVPLSCENILGDEFGTVT